MELVLDLLYKFLSCSLVIVSTFYIWSKLSNKKINYRDYKLYISFILITIISTFNYHINNQYIKIAIITIFLAICFWYVFRESFQKSIITAVFSQFIIMISEMIFAFGLILIFKVNPNDFVQIYFGTFLTNLIIAIICILISKIKYLKKLYNFSLRITDKIKSKQLVILLIILMIVANVYAGVTYYNFNFVYIMIFNVAITILCFLIIMNTLRTKNNYIEVNNKYNTTINALKEYEDMLDDYKVSNHENKNELLTIRNMIPKNNKKVISYIDQIIENKIKDNEKAMIEVSKIPSGGLRGLIYSKILLMKNSNINYQLEISKQIKTVDLIKINDNLLLDICKIIGVFLDNAIQEVEKLENKYILIEFYIENEELIIKITNNYKGNIEIDKLEEKGYTTKDTGHGYGLVLVKRIIENNKQLKNMKSINKDFFTQILKIKM